MGIVKILLAQHRGLYVPLGTAVCNDNGNSFNHLIIKMFKNKRKNKTKNSNTGGASLVKRIPAAYDANVVVCRKIRFQAQSTLTQAIVTYRCFFKLLITVINGSTNTINLIGAIRIRGFKLYASNATNGISTVAFEWKGTYVRNQEIADSGTSTYPAYVSVRPPPESDLGFWVSSDTDLIDNTVCLISGPAGMIIDLMLDYVLYDGAAALAGSTLTAASGFSGPVVMRLDNSTTGGATGAQLMTPLHNQSALFV